MSDEGVRSLVLRQFAALRRQGLGADVALAHLLEGLPDGPVRDDCQRASRALGSGGTVDGGSDFLRVLASPSGAPEHAECLAEACEAQLDAQDSLRAPTVLLQLILAGPLVLLALLGWLTRGSFLADTTLPLLTQALLNLASALRILGLPLAVACFFAIPTFRNWLSPGFAAFTSARRVLEASTRPESTVDLGALRLAPPERQVLEALRACGDFAPALRTLSAELTREGRASVARFRALAPVFALFVVVPLYLTVLTALYLPLLAIARATGEEFR